MESVISASVIALVVRTRRPFFRSRPGKYLLAATLATVAVTLALPFTPLAGIFHFEPLPFPFFLLIGGIVLLYSGRGPGLARGSTSAVLACGYKPRASGEPKARPLT